jgi:hypothetical protein
MIKRILLFLFLLLVVLSLFSEAVISSSLPGEQDAYRSALDSLLAVSGTPNADLYYNLGVSYYHTGSTGKATLWFLRALALDSSHRLARENLGFIQELLDKEHQAPPKPFLADLISRLDAMLSLNRLALILLLCLLASAACVHWLLHYPPDREKGLPVLLLGISLLFTLAFGLDYLGKYDRFLNNEVAVVTAPSADCYAEPGAGKEMFSVPEAYIVKVTQIKGKYSRVILPDGTRVWIRTAELESVSLGRGGREKK